MLAGILALSLLWPKALGGGESSSWTVIVEWIMAGSGAMLVTAFFLGGWILPGHSPLLDWHQESRLISGVIIFSIKTWLVILGARLLAGATRFDRRIIKTDISGFGIKWTVMAVLAVAAGALETIQIPAGLVFAGQIISAGIFFSLLSLLVFTKIIIFRPKGEKPDSGNLGKNFTGLPGTD
jgi:hypothetical protein